MPDPALRLQGLRKHFGATVAVAGIDLTVAPGEFVTLLGPSGCGKTTTLNLIAGFIAPTAGAIVLGGTAIDGLPPYRRNLGVVFQDYALFPHMSVAENVAFGLRMRGISPDDIARRVDEALALVKLVGFDARRPAQLSGGQRQRVALARALVIRPRMLLLDEPLSNLDLKLREEMRLEITRLQRQLGIATIFVTHDQGEALAMSDRIAVMHAGRIEQIGTPAAVYEEPRSRFVAEFIGRINIVPGTVQALDERNGIVRVATSAGIGLAATHVPVSPGAQMEVAFRPERVTLSEIEPAQDATINCMRARITEAVYLGARSEFRLETAGGQAIWVEAPNDRAHARLRVGANIHASIAASDCRII
jgi:spermidine/putrescine ABC transporter ATP-binding subunit